MTGARWRSRSRGYRARANGPVQAAGHCFDSPNHYRRDASLGEDASRTRARHALANNATLNRIALAIAFHRGFHYLPGAQMHFMMHCDGALHAILSPT